jgi:cobalt-precorrin-7 (C5)-methyltransferase
VHKIAVLAVGPGSAAYLPPVTVERAGQCNVLIGGKRNLALFDDLISEKIEITGQLAPVIALIREKMADCRIGILVSGDSGIYSILPRLIKEFGREALEVYPGISAVQYMFARIGRTWHNARFLSLHGREADDLAETVCSAELLVLFTDSKNTPALICRRLVEAGLTGRKVYIGEDLSYPTEKIREGFPEEFLNLSCSDLNLVVIDGE